MTASVIGPPGVVVAYRYAAYASPAGHPRASLATMIYEDFPPHTRKVFMIKEVGSRRAPLS